MTLTLRTATTADLPALRALMDRAIAQLQAGYLTPAQVAASAAMMGLDTQLIDDGGYLLALLDDQLAGGRRLEPPRHQLRR